MKANINYTHLTKEQIESYLSSKDMTDNEKQDIQYFYDKDIPLFKMDRLNTSYIMSKKVLLDKSASDETNLFNLCVSSSVLVFICVLVTIFSLWAAIYGEASSILFFFIFGFMCLATYSFISLLKDNLNDKKTVSESSKRIMEIVIPENLKDEKLKIELRKYDPLD